MKNTGLFQGLEIIDVIDFKRQKVNYYTKKRNFNVLSIRISGEAKFIYDDVIKVTDKKLLFIPKNIEYGQMTEGEHVIAIHFKGKVPYDTIVAFDTEADEVKRLFFDIVKLFRLKTDVSFYMAHCKLYKILAVTAEKMMSGIFKDKITVGYEEIQIHYTSPDIRIEDIVDKLGVSGVYFRREFKKRYEVTPKQMLINLRLNNAAMLLGNGYCNVGEAGLQCGFSDPNYFSSVFKKRFGIPPTEYAKHKSLAK